MHVERVLEPGENPAIDRFRNRRDVAQQDFADRLEKCKPIEVTRVSRAADGAVTRTWIPDRKA
jgi:hypothetical protein